MTSWHEIFSEKYWGNSVLEYLVSGAIALGVLLVLFLVKKILVSRLKHKSIVNDGWADYLGQLVNATAKWFLLAMALFAGSQALHLSAKLQKLIPLAALSLFLFQVALWGNSLINRYRSRYRNIRLQEDASSVTTVAILSFIAKLLLYTLILLLILQNAGINITALVAGLGIGGVAVALAAQNILGDLFASIAIAFDKPFAIGDFLIVGDLIGTVENIGMKTTRIQSLSGEQIILPNSDLMGSRIRNFKRMRERRVLFNVGLTYDSPVEKLGELPEFFQSAVEKAGRTRFDRAHFQSMGDSALIFEIVYYVLSPDYNVYMDVHQSILFDILRGLKKRDLEVAFPTRTVWLQKAASDTETADS